MSRVRHATSADAPEVARLIAEFRDWWSYDGPSDESIERSVRRLLADERTEFLLAEADGEPAGVCQLRYRYGVWLESEDCELEDLYLREEARGSGLGRELVEAAIEHARARGCGRIQLDTNEGNAAARALYESLGFSAWAETPGGNNLLMRRRL
ncbi:MAG TPA: GNAT family N-acetyltransferase [Thermoleophilaceae bacterium]